MGMWGTHGQEVERASVCAYFGWKQMCLVISNDLFAPCCPPAPTPLPVSQTLLSRYHFRNPDNRRCLGSAFNPATSASQSGKGMMTKLNDALILHEINDQAHEKVRRCRRREEMG